MTTERLIELIITFAGLLMGGGGMWAYLSNRKKANIEPEIAANEAALKNVTAVMETLRKRVDELANENALLREQIETERQQAQLRHEDELARAEEQKEYFANALTANQAQMAAMRVEFDNCHRRLQQKTAEVEEAQRRLESYLRRFPQFGEGFKRATGTGPLDSDKVSA